jgi:trk system potassium uptake protein TrkH
MTVFIPQFGAKGIWISVFTAISAFCNAGIDIIAENSLCNYTLHPLINLVTALLILLGGIGYIVWWDVLRVLKQVKTKRLKAFRFLTLHSKIAITVTLLLTLVGSALIFAFECNNPQTIQNCTLLQKIEVCLFQSITTRTAGFATLPQENLTNGASLVCLLLMFIGGSPVGTAGGVKTVTIFVILLNVRAFMKNQREVVYRGRRIPDTIVRKAIAIFTVQLSVSLVLCILLMAVSNVNMADAFYEMFSVVSTAGLTCGVTASVDTAGLWIVMIGMFVGRIGPITMLLFFQTPSPGRNDVRHAEGKYIVG